MWEVIGLERTWMIVEFEVNVVYIGIWEAKILLFTMEKMRGREENDGKSEACAEMVFKSLKEMVKVKRITVLRVKWQGER